MRNRDFSTSGPLGSYEMTGVHPRRSEDTKMGSVVDALRRAGRMVLLRKPRYVRSQGMFCFGLREREQPIRSFFPHLVGGHRDTDR